MELGRAFFVCFRRGEKTRGFLRVTNFYVHVHALVIMSVSHDGRKIEMEQNRMHVREVDVIQTKWQCKDSPLQNLICFWSLL